MLCAICGEEIDGRPYRNASDALCCWGCRGRAPASRVQHDVETYAPGTPVLVTRRRSSKTQYGTEYSGVVERQAGQSVWIMVDGESVPSRAPADCVRRIPAPSTTRPMPLFRPAWV